MTTSRSTRSSGSSRRRSSACGPESAAITAYPRDVRMASRSRTFCGTSSTTRTLPSSVTGRPSPLHEVPDLPGKGPDADGLLEVAVESGIEGPLPVLPHRQGRHRHDRHFARPLAAPEEMQSLRSVHARQLEVHEDEIGTVLLRQGDSFLARTCFEHVEAGEMQDVAEELEIALVVLHHEDSVGGHDVPDPDGICASLAFRTRSTRPAAEKSPLSATEATCPCSRFLSEAVIAFAVSTTMGTSRVAGCSRSASVTAKPSMSGISRSRSTTEGCACRARTSPFSPLSALSTVQPDEAITAVMSSRTAGSSSMTRRVRPASESTPVRLRAD